MFAVYITACGFTAESHSCCYDIVARLHIVLTAIMPPRKSTILLLWLENSYRGAPIWLSICVLAQWSWCSASTAKSGAVASSGVRLNGVGKEQCTKIHQCPSTAASRAPHHTTLMGCQLAADRATMLVKFSNTARTARTIKRRGRDWSTWLNKSIC